MNGIRMRSRARVIGSLTTVTLPNWKDAGYPSLLSATCQYREEIQGYSKEISHRETFGKRGASQS